MIFEFLSHRIHRLDGTGLRRRRRTTADSTTAQIRASAQSEIEDRRRSGRRLPEKTIREIVAMGDQQLSCSRFDGFGDVTHPIAVTTEHRPCEVI
jgi:hypothetical protein